MSGTARLTQILAVSQHFAAHHSLDLPGANSVLGLGSDVGKGAFGTVVGIDTIYGTAPQQALLVERDLQRDNTHEPARRGPWCRSEHQGADPEARAASE